MKLNLMRTMETTWLTRIGAALLLAGMVSGLATSAMTNPRMALSAHLEGLMNGTLLIALAAIWDRVALRDRLRQISLLCFCFGSVTNWLATQLAALWGTGSMTPIVGAGRAASHSHELVVSVGLIASTLAMLVATVFLLAGLFNQEH